MQAAGDNRRTLRLDERQAEETWSSRDRSRAVRSTAPSCDMPHIPHPCRRRALQPFAAGIDPNVDRYGRRCRSGPQSGIAREQASRAAFPGDIARRARLGGRRSGEIPSAGDALM